MEHSPEAIAIATGNLQAPREGPMASVELMLGSWWEPLQSFWGQLELVVSNPPYIPTAIWAALIRWCVTTNRPGPWMGAAMASMRFAALAKEPLRPWPQVAGCCWSTTTTKAWRFRGCCWMPAWSR